MVAWESFWGGAHLILAVIGPVTCCHQTGILPLPQAEGIFYLSFLEEGEVFQTLNDMFEFLYDDDGVVTGFEFRAEDDTLWMVGTRQ